MNTHFRLPPRKNPIFKSVVEFEGTHARQRGIRFGVRSDAPGLQKKFAIKQVNLTKIAPVDYENVFKELEIHSRVSSPFLVEI